MQYLQKFDMVDTVLSYGRALIVCKFLQESSKVKESSLQESEIQIPHFYLVGQMGQGTLSLEIV